MFAKFCCIILPERSLYSGIGDDCSLVSVFVLTLIILLSRLSRYGSRSFAVCHPAAWNSLPAVTRDLSSSPSCFCRPCQDWTIYQGLWR